MRKKILSLVLTLAMVLSMLPVAALAADSDFTIENGVLTKYTGPGGAVTIPNSVTSIGSGAFLGCTGLTSVTIPSSVTSIGNWAFSGCTGLTNVTIPSSVTSIEAAAFSGCTGLTSVTIPDSVTSIGYYAFSGCTGLTSVTIGDGVTSIGSGAFQGCTGLTSITIPESVTSIEYGAFGFCTSLTDIQIDAENSAYVSIDEVLFTKDEKTLVTYPGGKRGVYAIPDGVTNIGENAFQGCTGLTTVTIPSSVTSIGRDVFPSCTSLTDIQINAENSAYASIDGVLFTKDEKTLVTCPGGKQGVYAIPDGVTNIGENAFQGCTGPISVTIPDSVTSIGNWAFSGCTGLTSVTIPDSVTSIEGQAFSGCTGLTSVTIPDSVTSIELWAFAGCTGLTSVTIPDSVANIEMGTFAGCTGLTSVTFGSGLRMIGPHRNPNYYAYEGAFQGCTGLTNVVIPDGVRQIGNNSFRDCTGLTSAAIPDSVTTIYNTTFADCDNLKDIYYSGTAEQWAELTFFPPDGAIIHYNSTGPENDPAEWPINQNGVFIPQETDYTCTLASATMMLRRRAILEERDNWATITEASVGSVAWVPNVGLRFQFPYGGIYHCNAIWPGQAAKKEYFIEMLKQHPEGIVIYRTDNAQWHAVLLTDYDESSGTFYCADPAPGYASLGRIPLTNCSILKGGSQDAKINSISQIWCISDAAIKTLSSLSGTLHCPVEMLLVIGDERLDSRGVMGTITNSDGTVSLTATGSGENREISFVIPGECVVENKVGVEISGTDNGSMTLTLEESFTDGSTETQKFENVPVKESTQAVVDRIYPQTTTILELSDQENANQPEYWVANPNETASEPSTDLNLISKFPSSPDTPDVPVGPSHPSGGSGSTSASYGITAPTTTGGTVTVKPSSASKGDTVTVTATPDNGYELASLTVTGKDGKDIALTGKGDNKYSFTMPDGKVTVSAEFIPVKSNNPFTDVGEGTYYYDAVLWAVENGITEGTTATTFSPDVSCTRAQIVTLLWRAAGSPAASGNSPFTDVPQGSYYYDAVLWAVAQGITSGTSATTFSPDAVCTRAQAVTFLYRTAETPAMAGTSPFTDVVSGSYYTDAVRWAVGKGVVNGTTPTTFSPEQTCTRAQIVTLLYRDRADKT